MKKKWLIFSLIGNIIGITLLTVFIIKKGGVEYIEKKLFPSNYAKVSNSKLIHYTIIEKDSRKVSLFNLLPISEGDIIFVGNSIMDGCEWAEILNNNRIKNRSIDGDNSLGILERIDKLSIPKPQKIFLMVGINDLRAGVKIDSIAKNYSNIVKTIKFYSPKTKVFIQSTLPVNEGITTVNNKDIIELNSKIKNIAIDENVTYIDIFSHLLDSSGKLSKEYSSDGLHLLGAGYLKWKNIIEPYVN